MFQGKRGDRAASGRRRRTAAFIEVQPLEGRQLLASSLDLANIASQNLGIQQAGLTPNLGAGFSVTDVGDVNGDGFQDFLVGAPTVLTGSNGPSIANGTGSTAYLIFGSQQVTAQTITDWLTLTPAQRIGDLGQLGQATQTNPSTGLAGFPFNGLAFTTGSNLNSNLGASVVALGDLNGDGLDDFMIGAPGALNANGTGSGTGRAYIVYGSATLASTTTKTVNLDAPATFPTNIVTFVANTTGALVGFSGADLGNFFNNNFNDIAIGAPGVQANTGRVYVISGAVLRAPSTTTINLDTVGQSGGIAGVILNGQNPGDLTGWSIAGAGDVNGATINTSSTLPVDDLAIGAPQTGSGTGEAYLLYGGTNFAPLATTIGGQTVVPLSLVGGSGTSAIPGALFTGGALSMAGFSVASAGDFNDDTFGDFMIGAPNAFNTSGVLGLGAVYLIEGAGPAAAPSGTIDLTNIPSSIPSVTFTGPSAGSLAGFSETAVGDMNGDGINEIAIGAPGFNSEQGAAYIVPGNPDLGGIFTLGASQLFGTQLVASGSVTPALFGSSVGGNINLTAKGNTADGDDIGDLIIGAPGYSLPVTPATTPPTTTRNTAGTAFVVEGANVGLAVPVSNAITTQIGIGAAFGPFSINATTPATLNIFVFSNAAFNFNPVTQINTATITLNGVAFPNATIAQDPIDENNDGIPDAIITISPRSALNLVSGTVTFTLRGRTTAASGNLPFTGTATVSVSGGSSGGGSGPAFSTATAIGVAPTEFLPPNGSALIPTIAALSQYDSYVPLAQSIAYAQFRPSAGWLLRMEVFAGRISQRNANIQRHEAAFGGRSTSGVRTLAPGVFTRDSYHPAKVVKVKLKVPVIPRDRQRSVGAKA